VWRSQLYADRLSHVGKQYSQQELCNLQNGFCHTAQWPAILRDQVLMQKPAQACPLIAQIACLGCILNKYTNGFVSCAATDLHEHFSIGPTPCAFIQISKLSCRNGPLLEYLRVYIIMQVPKPMLPEALCAGPDRLHCSLSREHINQLFVMFAGE
jgi:hypothetical protein